MGLSLWRETEGLDGDHLVGAEAVVQLAHLDVVGGDLGFLHGALGGQLAHAVADELDGAAAEELRLVSGEALAGDEDGLALELGAGVKEGLRDEDGGGGAVGRGAALQLCEWLMDHGRLHDLLERVFVLELRVGVVLGVCVVDASDFGKVLKLGAVPGGSNG